MSLKYEPSSEALQVSVKQLFFNRELYRSVQLSPSITRLLASVARGCLIKQVPFVEEFEVFQLAKAVLSQPPNLRHRNTVTTLVLR